MLRCCKCIYNPYPNTWYYKKQIPYMVGVGAHLDTHLQLLHTLQHSIDSTVKTEERTAQKFLLTIMCTVQAEERAKFIRTKIGMKMIKSQNVSHVKQMNSVTYPLFP